MYMSAKAAFGTLNKNMYQSDYLKMKKKGVTMDCNCRFYYHNNQNNNNTFFSTNKYNLIIGQYTEMNLKNVVTVNNITSSPVIINPSDSNPFYYTNTIDPYGQLFGNSPCGILNYVQYITSKSKSQAL
jgi:hypothetical protein